MKEGTGAMRMRTDSGSDAIRKDSRPQRYPTKPIIDTEREIPPRIKLLLKFAKIRSKQPKNVTASPGTHASLFTCLNWSRRIQRRYATIGGIMIPYENSTSPSQIAARDLKKLEYPTMKTASRAAQRAKNGTFLLRRWIIPNVLRAIVVPLWAR
jgi:hypothetical protein